MLQGRRSYQEDRSVAVDDLHQLLKLPTAASFRNNSAAFYGVFDGHQGAAASEWCSKKLAAQVANATYAGAQCWCTMVDNA